MANKIRGRNEGSISKRPNGNWRAQISLNGKRLSYSAKTKEQCRIWLREKQTQMDNGLTYDHSKTTVEAFMINWLTSIKPSIRYTTWEQYQRYAKNIIFPGIGQSKIVDLKPDQIQYFYDHLLQQGIGYHALLKTHTVLRSALSRAFKLGMIPRNPAFLVTLPKHPNEEMKILDESQVNQLLISVTGHRWEALFHLAITSGMREGELLGLKWTDLDWINYTLKVERQFLRPHGEGNEFASTKTKFGRRSVKLGVKTIEVLHGHYELQQQDRIKAGDKWQENGLIFTNHIGGPILCRNLLREYKKLLKEAGLPSIRFHDLRHTAASLMLNHNIPVIVASRRLGHSRPSVTLDVYGHLMANAQNEAAELMDNLTNSVEINPTAPELHQVFGR